MRSTIHQLTNASQLLCEADTWLLAELIRLRSDKDKSLSKKLATARERTADQAPRVPRCMGG